MCKRNIENIQHVIFALLLAMQLSFLVYYVYEIIEMKKKHELVSSASMSAQTKISITRQHEMMHPKE